MSSICYIKLEAECTTIYPSDSLLMETYSNVFAVINNANAPLYKHIWAFGGVLLYDKFLNVEALGQKFI